MQLSNVPTKFVTPFGSGAAGADIRAIPVTSPDPNAASQTLGWPPTTFAPEGAGGVPPDGRDMNGIDNMMSAWCRWLSVGGVIQYDATQQAAVGGYPKWAIVGSLSNPGTYWQSSTDNNVTNPDSSGAGWSSWPAASSVNWGSPGSIGTTVPNIGVFSILISVANITAGGYVDGTDLQINGVGFTTSLGSSGYQRLPTGLIIQWGRLNTPSGSGDVVAFPVTFPTNCSIAMDVGNDGSGAPFDVNGSLSGPPFSSVQVWSFKSGSVHTAGVSYVAVGN